MVRLVIEVDTEHLLMDALETIKPLIDRGFTSGYHPYWTLDETPDPLD